MYGDIRSHGDTRRYGPNPNPSPTQVSTTLKLSPLPDGSPYIVMPATFGPGALNLRTPTLPLPVPLPLPLPYRYPTATLPLPPSQVRRAPSLYPLPTLARHEGPLLATHLLRRRPRAPLSSRAPSRRHRRCRTGRTLCATRSTRAALRFIGTNSPKKPTYVKPKFTLFYRINTLFRSLIYNDRTTGSGKCCI